MMHAHVSSGAGVKGGRALPCEGGRQGPRVPSWPCPASNLAPALALSHQPGARRGAHERGRAPPVRTLGARRTHRMTSRDAA